MPPPIIDVGPLRDYRAGREGASCIEAIDAACTDTGFFVATGHGLGEPLDALFAMARLFFAQHPSAKEAVPRKNRYGFVPHSSQAIDRERASDLSEYLDLGLGVEVPMPAIEGFRQAVRSYQGEALELADAILRALAIALGLPAGFFVAPMRRPQCRLRLLHYLPAPAAADGSPPVLNRPHTDYGLLTLLATGGTAGLEIEGRDGVWAPVEQPAGSLVVNLGDMVARWTNDRYASTPHRAIGSTEHDRVSIPFFVNPNPATEISCLPSCVNRDRPCRYEPITAGEFLAARIDGKAEPYVDTHDESPRTADG